MFHGTFFGVHHPCMTSLSTYEGINGQKSVHILDLVNGWRMVGKPVLVRQVLLYIYLIITVKGAGKKPLSSQVQI